MASDDLCWTPARELARMIRAKDVSPVEVVDAVLARIARVNPPLNAYVTIAAEQARDAAKAAERDVARGDARGPLHGVPFSAKDLTATKGVRTTMGSKIFEHNVPDEDALLVQRLRGAGAILLGKTNTPEFGCKPATDNRVFGATHNPWALDRSPGGSSGGAAAAVASGLGPLAEGGDLAGSIRHPAAWCGVVGFKPTQGRIARYPNAAGWSAMSSNGPITRTVADAALMFSVMAGPDDRDPLSLPQHRRGLGGAARAGHDQGPAGRVDAGPRRCRRGRPGDRLGVRGRDPRVPGVGVHPGERLARDREHHGAVPRPERRHPGRDRRQIPGQVARSDGPDSRAAPRSQPGHDARTDRGGRGRAHRVPSAAVPLLRALRSARAPDDLRAGDAARRVAAEGDRRPRRSRAISRCSSRRSRST